MATSKKSAQINATFGPEDQALLAEIRRRADQLGSRWSMSAFVVDICRWWHVQGCPAVTPQDQAMIVAAQMAEKAPKKGRA